MKDERNKQIRLLRKHGAYLSKIAKAYGISRHRVAQICDPEKYCPNITGEENVHPLINY